MPEDNITLMAAIIYGNLYIGDNTLVKDEEWRENSRVRDAVRIAKKISSMNRNWIKNQ